MKKYEKGELKDRSNKKITLGKQAVENRIINIK